MDPEFGYSDQFAFSEKSVRKAFIRKVYAILSLQLLITFGIVAIFAYPPTVSAYVRDHSAFLWVSLAVSITLMIVLSCAGDIRRKAPINFICLFGFTASEGVLLGSICAYLDTWEISIAIVATLLVSIALTVFAFQTKIDFTMQSGAILSLTMCLFTFAIFALIFQSDVLNLLYACLGALVFSLYLVFDTQMILGGKHKISISPEEYVFAALNLYLDIINLFLLLLAITGSSRG